MISQCYGDNTYYTNHNTKKIINGLYNLQFLNALQVVQTTPAM